MEQECGLPTCRSWAHLVEWLHCTMEIRDSQYPIDIIACRQPYGGESRGLAQPSQFLMGILPPLRKAR